MVSALVSQALTLLLPRDTRFSRRVGLEQLGLLLLLKWLDHQEPGVFLAPLPDKVRWAQWANRRDVQRDLSRFVDAALLPQLRDLADQDSDKLLAPLFRQENIVHSTFAETAHGALALINELDLSQPAVRRECAHVYLTELQSLRDDTASASSVPDAICVLAVQWADLKENAVLYDPACASGAFLAGAMAALQDAGRPPAVGIADTTERQLLFTMVVAVLEMGMPPRVRLAQRSYGTRLYPKDAWETPRIEADFIVTNPPFGFDRDVTGKRRKTGEWQPGRLDGLFLARSLAALNPKGGRMAIILPDGCLSSTQRSMVELRKQLLDGCHVVCVISLPASLFAGSTAKSSLLFVERSGKATDEMLYCELPLVIFGDPAVMHDLCEAVVELCRRWHGGMAPPTDQDGLPWWTVKADICRAQGYTMAPLRPLSAIDLPDVEPPGEVIKRLLAATRELDQVLRNLQRALPRGEGARP